MTQPHVQIERLAGTLAAAGGLKLWSVIVTILGDISAEGAKEVSGLALTGIIERIGLQPQAMRVALHRLKRDGWIDSRREGRVVFYRLSDVGLARSQAVRERIYGSAGAAQMAVHLAVLPNSENKVLADLPEDFHALALAPRTILVGGDPASFPEDWMIARLSGTGLPGWVQDELQQATCETEFRAWIEALDRLSPDRITDPLERFALRVLVLHGWRRLVLRSEPLAESLLGAGCALYVCRDRVHRLLSLLTLPAQLEVSA